MLTPFKSSSLVLVIYNKRHVCAYLQLFFLR